MILLYLAVPFLVFTAPGCFCLGNINLLMRWITNLWCHYCVTLVIVRHVPGKNLYMADSLPTAPAVKLVPNITSFK